VVSSGFVTLTVSDGDLVTTEDFEITVAQVNDVPVITSFAPIAATEDIQYVYQVVVVDPDNDSFSFTLANAPDGMNVTNEGLLTWTPLEGVTTSGVVTLTVNDGELTDTEDFEITVEQINDIPVIASVAPNTAMEDIEYLYQIIVEDPDNDSFDFTLENAPEGMTISDTGLISWVPEEGVLSSGLVTLTVSDNEFDVTELFAITVTQVNDAPIIASTAPDFVYLGETYIYDVDVIDPDDSEFTYVLENALDGMSIANGVISWTPDVVGQYGPITIIVADGGEDGSVAAEEEFSILVDYDYTVIDFNLAAGNNLISLYSIPPEDQSVEFVFDSLGDNVTHIIGESQLALHLPNGNWAGSLNTLTADKGYWVRINESDELPVYGLPSEDVEYVIHEGANLISYSHATSQNIEDALPEEVQQNIWAIFGQNMSVMNINGNWLGSLNSFEGGQGYWVIASDNFVFEYNQPEGITRLADHNMLPEVPEDFKYYQSVEQSFYFVKDINLENTDIQKGDWIVAYNGDVVVGARMWNGEYTDIPAMGYDASDENTFGYCKKGDVPVFKLHKANSLQIIDLVSSDIQEWNSNQAFVVELTGLELPLEVSLDNAYPNPFNPSTTIRYNIPEGGMHANLSIYDLRGRLIVELVNEFKESTFDGHKVVWDASSMASGVYFIKLSAGSSIQTQKIMLIK
jgi:hypothetical protein